MLSERGAVPVYKRREFVGAIEASHTTAEQDEPWAQAGAATISSPDLSWGLCWREPQALSAGHLQGAEYAAHSRMALGTGVQGLGQCGLMGRWDSRDHPPGVFQVALDRVEKDCCWHPVDDPMVEGQAEEQHRPLGDLSLVDHWLLDHPVHPQDANLWRAADDLQHCQAWLMLG